MFKKQKNACSAWVYIFRQVKNNTCVINNTHGTGNENVIKNRSITNCCYIYLLHIQIAAHTYWYIIAKCFINTNWTQLTMTFKSFEKGFLMTWHMVLSPFQSSPCCYAHFTVNWTLQPSYGGRIVYDVSEKSQRSKEPKKTKKNKKDTFMYLAQPAGSASERCAERRVCCECCEYCE